MKLRSRSVLRALMDQNGLSLTDVAKAAQCTRGFISHLTSGRRHSCSTDVALRIAGALSVPLNVLFVANGDQGEAA